MARCAALTRRASDWPLRNLRELDERDVEGQGKHLLDKTSGETLEVVTSHVDMIEPKASGAVAFCNRDGWLVLLRPLGWHNAEDKSSRLGEVFGRQATARDPMPMPTEIY